MAEEPKGKGTRVSKTGNGKSPLEHFGEVASRDKDSGVWIREDGAICFGNECVDLSKKPTGELSFEVDPSACGKETGKVVLSYLIENLASREPINIVVKPQAKAEHERTD